MYLSSPTIAPYGFAGLGATLSDLAAAITRMEGSCSAPGVCRNNNPGNLRAYAAGQAVDSRGIRIFPTYEAGYNALLAQEQLNIGKGLTLSEFFGGKAGVYPGYAPSGDANDPGRYTGNVSNWLGIPSDVPLSQLMGDSNVQAPFVGSDSVSSGAVADSPPQADWSDGSEVWLPAGTSEDGLSPLAWGAIALGVGAALWAIA